MNSEKIIEVNKINFSETKIESIEKMLQLFNMKIRVKMNGLDAEIVNEKEILALNKLISPYRFEIEGGFIMLLKDDECIDSIDFND